MKLYIDQSTETVIRINADRTRQVDSSLTEKLSIMNNKRRAEYLEREKENARKLKLKAELPLLLWVSFWAVYSVVIAIIILLQGVIL